MPPDTDVRKITSTTGWAALTKELVHGTPAKLKRIRAASTGLYSLRRR